MIQCGRTRVSATYRHALRDYFDTLIDRNVVLGLIFIVDYFVIVEAAGILIFLLFIH